MSWKGDKIMTFTVVVCAITGILVFISVLVKPHFNIGKIQIGTYWVISCIGALVLILSGSVPIKYLLSELNSQAQINPIKILILFFTMTSLSIFLDEVGFFRYLANLAIKKTGKSQIKLFIIIYALVSILTIFTSNDIVILTFTPFICFFAKEAHINPIPYLFGEFVGANTWSMFLIIGNPTNIYIPEGLTTIDDGAFWECFRLTNITLPNSLRHIGHKAFWRCNIDSINLPIELNHIEDDAFMCGIPNRIIIPYGSKNHFESMLPEDLHNRLIDKTLFS